MVLALAALVVGALSSVVSASNHNWGSGTPYRECTEQGLTNYGPKTGQKWIGGRYKNLYNCTAPTTTTTASTTTTTRAADWGSGTPYRECTEQGLTNYGPKTGQKWIGGRYKNLYNCTAPTTTTTASTTTTTRAADWGSGTPYRECTERGLTNYGPRTGQKWIGDRYKDLYNCTAPTTTPSTTTTTTTTAPPGGGTTPENPATTSGPTLGTAPELPYSGTTSVTLRVSYGEQFTMVEYYYKCPTKAGGDPFESEASRYRLVRPLLWLVGV